MHALGLMPPLQSLTFPRAPDMGDEVKLVCPRRVGSFQPVPSGSPSGRRTSRRALCPGAFYDHAPFLDRPPPPTSDQGILGSQAPPNAIRLCKRAGSEGARCLPALPPPQSNSAECVRLS
jgi:hypothetical protein